MAGNMFRPTTMFGVSTSLLRYVTRIRNLKKIQNNTNKDLKYHREIEKKIEEYKEELRKSIDILNKMVEEHKEMLLNNELTYARRHKLTERTELALSRIEQVSNDEDTWS